jgi:DNA-binding transcriptional LysR family regulator
MQDMILRPVILAARQGAAGRPALRPPESQAEAARTLNVTPPAVTQRLRTLEERVGVRLVDRSGPRLSLTEEGSLIASHGRVVTDALETLTEALADRRSVVSGHLTIAAPHGFGRLHVAPVIDAFAREHPKVTVAHELSDHPAARLIDSFDVVIHIGAPTRMDDIVTTLAPNRRILCASPDYLDAVPDIRSPRDLAEHRCLAIRENDEDVTLWRFGGPRQEIVRVDPVLSSNDGAVIREWALAGQGIVIRSEWDVAHDLAAGRLREVLPSWKIAPANVVALLSSRHGRSARTTAFLAFLRQSLAPRRGASSKVARVGKQNRKPAFDVEDGG